MNEIKIGDIFYTAWGYDQTNYDYLVVVGFTSSKKSAICQMAKFDTVGYESCCNVQKPKAEGFGDKFKLRIQEFHGEVTLRGSYPFIDGKIKTGKRMGLFRKAKEGETFNETDPVFGH